MRHLPVPRRLPFLAALFVLLFPVARFVPAASAQGIAAQAIALSAAQPAAAAQNAAQAPAANPDAGFLNFFRAVDFGGLADAYYMVDSTKEPLLFHSFDTAYNAFTLSMAEVWVNKVPTSDSPVGFKVKTIFGPAATTINFNEPNTDLVNIEEGYVSYLAPIGKGLQFDVGKFVTTAGAEVIEAKDDWNYSRSILFQNAIPFYHAGVRLTYAPNDKVTLIGGVVNGWNDVTENNTGKTILASVIAKPIGALSVAENFISGPEQPNNNSDWRNLSDTVVSYTVNDMVSLLGNYDYGHDNLSGGHWQGVAGYVKVQANKYVAIVPRAEYFSDPAGFSGAVQKLKEFTLTVELKPADNFMWRLEYRGDFSDVPVFTNDDGTPEKNQQEFVMGFLYSFSTKQ